MRRTHPISNKNLHKKGSVVLDAAISLSAFLLAFVLIISLILETEEELNAYIHLCKKAEAVSFASDAIGVEIPFLAAICFTESRGTAVTLYYRPFTGSSYQTDSENITVYIYENTGTKYHRRGCSTLINNEAYTKMSKAEAEKRGYTECSLCCKDGNDYFKKKSAP